MKKIKYILVLLMTLLLVDGISQRESRRERKKDEQTKFIFGDNDPDFDVTTAPAEWKDEPIVVLCQKFSYYYNKTMNGMVLDQIFRKRLKLNKQSAIEEYSVFYFSNSKEFDLKVVKADGSEERIDLDKAVEVGVNEVPDFYRNSSTVTYQKIAIPNLVEGDILDYYFKYSGVDPNKDWYYGPRYQFTFAGQFPILKQKFFYNMEKGFKMMFRTFNSDIKLVDEGIGTNNLGNIDKKTKVFTFETGKIDKLKNEYWINRYDTEPYVKMRVLYFKGKKSIAENLLDPNEDFITTREPTKDEIIAAGANLYNGGTTGVLEGAVVRIRKEYKKNKKNLANDTERTIFLYELARKESFSTMSLYYPGMRQRLASNEEFFFPESMFLWIMRSSLKFADVPYKLILGTSNKGKGFTDVAFPNELYAGISVQGIAYFPFTNFADINRIPVNILNSECVELDPENPGKYTEMKFTTDHKKNRAAHILELEISDDFEEIAVKHNNVYEGYMKAGRSRYVLNGSDHIVPPVEAVQRKTRNAEKLAERARKKAELDKERTERENKLLKSYYEGDYEIKQYNGFTLESSGSFAENPKLIFEEDYVIEKLISRAGRNYVFQIGKLIGSQFELEKEDKTRTYDIAMDYAKSYSYEFTITLPEGYYMDGIENLNTSTVSEFGAFYSTAELKDGKVILKTNKEYRKANAKKENWNDYVAFLEEAYNFSQKKVVIKKK
ncbi:MAG: hypothetical protein ABF242_04025 [Flavobacteriales bacterium]